MRYLTLLLVFLFSLMLCLASGCTGIAGSAGSILENVVPGTSPGSGPSNPGDPLTTTTEPGPHITFNPAATETTLPKPVTTNPLQIPSPATTVTTPTTPVTMPTTEVTTSDTTVTIPPTRVTTPPTTITTPPTTITTIPTTVTTTPTTTTPTPPPGDVPHAIEQWVLRLTNDERAALGIAPLAWDDALAVVARDHSTDMAEHHFFSHTNPQGEGPTERAQRMGYPTRKDLGGGWYSEGIGENINQMPTGNVVGYGYVNNDAESIGHATVKAFMDSPGHRGLILKAEFSNIGVGVAYDGTYYYTTQNFW